VRRAAVLRRLILPVSAAASVASLLLAGGWEPRANAADRPDLPLREFKPRTVARLAAHEVPRAAFAAVDFHNHVNDGRGDEKVPLPELLARMDRLNLARLVILTGGWGDRLERVLNETARAHPDRFTVFTEVDWKRIDEPGFGEAMARQVRDSVARGARGLKITKVLGLEVRDRSGRLVPVDDGRLDPIWSECGRLGIPVAIHVSDPDAFFEPVDATNERWDELGQFPEWSFHGPRFPSKREILDARNRVFARHPQTTFVALHVANHPEDLEDVRGVLDRYKNVVIETGARLAELGRAPRAARSLFLDYPDRILFGTDMAPDEAMYRNWFRWLETADEYFDYYNYPTQGRWKVYGLELPREVLQKFYSKNAERVLAGFKGAPAR
jgi:predicted TIM-barrel fold metal-dependent hydrolase